MTFKFQEDYERYCIYSYTLRNYYSQKPDYFIKDYDEHEALTFETMLALSNYWKDIT
jgi:hypothetical protein